MLKLIKYLIACTFWLQRTFVSANEIEVNMENVLEVGRENQKLSANSQDRIDQTERQTDKIVNEYKVVSKQVEGLKFIMNKKEFKFKLSLIYG